MYITISKNIIYIILFLTILFAGFLRLYKLDQNPPALYWDEVAVGYNSYSIANFGIDEWGKTLPLTFKSFGEYKNPIHIYITAIFIKLLGHSDFATRLPSAILGIANTALLYFLANKIFKNNVLAILSAIFFAISPFNIQFSRFNHEINFVLFFFFLGLIFFYKSFLQGKFFVFFVIFFILSFISYNAPKVFLPIFTIFLAAIYNKEIRNSKINFIPTIVVAVVFLVIIYFNLNLLGFERFKQATFNSHDIEETLLYKNISNLKLGEFELVLRNYLEHLKPKYLFISGDPNPRHSIQTIGQFYKSEVIFIFMGFLICLLNFIKTKNKNYLLLLSWALIAPLPAVISREVPHAPRSMFMEGSWQILGALGIFSILNITKNKFFKFLVLGVILFILSFEFNNYFYNYHLIYSKKYSIEWQYGMKEVAKYIDDNKSSYHTIYITNKRHHPYIFILNYLKYSPKKFQESVSYNTTESASHNLVSSFGKYYFDWEVIESPPSLGVLYVLTPSEYGGLRYKSSFDVKKVIKYLDEGDAFYLVTAKVEEL